MKKSLIIFFAALASLFSARAAITADWKMHMPFDQWPVQVVETQGRVYMLSRTFEQNRYIPSRDLSSLSLFYYDKENDEIVSVNERTNSNGNAVSCVAYNPDEKYLVVAYTDCNVDFIYDNGKVYNVPALSITSIPGKKEINSITLDPKNNTVYLATTFGYIALNDKRYEVLESRNYGENIASIGRSGDNIILVSEGDIFYAPAKDYRFNFSDYTRLAGPPQAYGLILFDTGDTFYATAKTDTSYFLYRFFKENDGYRWEQYADDPQFFGMQRTPTGHQLTGNVRIFNFDTNGNVSQFNRPQSEWRNPAAALNANSVWSLTSQKGLRQFKQNGSDWELTRDYMRPNSPATYIATSATYHPSYGIMVGSHGIDIALSEFSQGTPNQISALKGGFWKEYGPGTLNPGKFANSKNYFGIAIDPKDSKYVYRGSVTGGLMRINLEDPDDVLIMANPQNANSKSDKFIPIADDLEAWNILCFFTTPQFTADGTMWTLYNYHDEEEAQLWYWPAQDRAACTSAATYRPMKKIPIPKFVSSNQNVMIMLKKNPTMSVIGGFGNMGSFIIYDHRGTLDKTSDDRYEFYNHPVDQDGGNVSFLNINNVVEDPETGIVWVCSQRGLFTINPATAFDNPGKVNRIKVARNDGTNLADYLLNEINVYNMSIDGEGRKWFGTSNGLVCTSADGRSILGEFTKENSYLPDDNVYATCYNPETNSLIVCTNAGVVEMFPSGSGGASADSESKMRVYPNPVEPDYFGWVRIDNVADGSLVKITDSKGGIVKELGPVQGGSVEWDVSGLNNRRVTTGVYYVMVSPGSGGGKSEISKILVLN